MRRHPVGIYKVSYILRFALKETRAQLQGRYTMVFMFSLYFRLRIDGAPWRQKMH